MKKIVNILKFPAHIITEGIHRLVPHDRKKSKICVGFLIMVVGGFLAVEIHQTVVPHFVWDTACYFIHGFGATPLVESILAKID